MSRNWRRKNSNAKNLSKNVSNRRTSSWLSCKKTRHFTNNCSESQKGMISSSRKTSGFKRTKRKNSRLSSKSTTIQYLNNQTNPLYPPSNDYLFFILLFLPSNIFLQSYLYSTQYITIKNYQSVIHQWPAISRRHASSENLAVKCCFLGCAIPRSLFRTRTCFWFSAVKCGSLICSLAATWE